MQQKIDKKKALVRAQNICAKQEKCKADIMQKLYEWKLEPQYMDEILDQLEKDKFIDENRYVGFFVRDKYKLNKWGKLKIEYALKSKNISEDLIRDSLDRIDTDEYKQLCRDLITKKHNGLKGIDPLKLKEKLLRFGHSRGFEASLVFKITEEILSER